MKNIALLKKEVSILRDRITPQSSQDIALFWCFGRDDEPHGKYGGRIHHLLNGKVDPVSIDEEEYWLKKEYEAIPEYVRRLHNGEGLSGSWMTFEGYLKSHECKCGRPHPYNPDCCFNNLRR